MAKLSYSERFTNVNKYDETGSYIGLQIVSKLNQKNGQDYKLLDAIDIDWNGAWLAIANSYINNTDELLAAIDHLGELSDYVWVHDQINQLNKDVDEIQATYVTQSQLDEILVQYQNSIKAGEHITIDSYNVISTYGLLTPEEGDEKYTSLETFENFINEIQRNYYRKDQTEQVAHNIAIDEIQDKIVKNADERFNDLEKISNWINSLPTELMDLSDISGRVDRLDEVVGDATYDDETGAYTYTGLVGTAHDFELFSQDMSNQVRILRNDVADARENAYVAYNTSITSYELAYIAYITSTETDELAYNAYQMAYHSVIIIGNPSSYSYFTPLTEEQIALLNEDPNALEVYSIKPDNQSGIPRPDGYRQNSGLEYYTYTSAVESTGFYKELEEMDERVTNAQQSADNALFRLYTRTDGTSYAKLELEPFINDGTNSRTMVLEVDEADIDIEDGSIDKEGIITTYSLYNAFAYAFDPEFITKDD